MKKQQRKQTPSRASSTRDILFDLAAPLGITLSERPGLEALQVDKITKGSQAFALGVRCGWNLVSVGNQSLVSLSGNQDRVSLVSQCVRKRKQDFSVMEAKGDTNHESRFLTFRFIAMEERKQTKLSDEIDDFIDEVGNHSTPANTSDVIDAFAGYSSPRSSGGSKEQKLATEKKILQKIKELHEALVDTKEENQKIFFEIESMEKAHEATKKKWSDRESSAAAELERFRKLLDAKRIKHTIYAQKGAKEFKSPDSKKRLKAYKPPKLSPTVKNEPKRAFSSGISTTSHRFNRKTSTSTINIPERILSLPVFEKDFPRPVFKISIPELLQAREEAMK